MSTYIVHTPMSDELFQSYNTFLYINHLIFNSPCKHIGEDYDDEHHSRLLERQHKNNNDASPIFASIPVGSAVAVQ